MIIFIKLLLAHLLGDFVLQPTTWVLDKEIKKHNSIPDFIFEGDFRKIEGNGFGFFKNISHLNGTVLTYPVSNDSIDEIFVLSGELSNGKRYSFEATIARRFG